MSVILRCPACRQKMQVALYFQGTRVICTSCERELDVPYCIYDAGESVDDANAAMDEADFLENLAAVGKRQYEVRIISNRSRRASVGALPTVLAHRRAMLFLLVIAALIGMLCLWSTLKDPSATASIVAGG